MENTYNPKWFATGNFHGQYYLDSDKLNNMLNFRHDGIDYFYDCFEKSYGLWAKICRAFAKISFFQKWIKKYVYHFFKKLAYQKSGTMPAIEDKDEKTIAMFWSSRDDWQKISEHVHDFPLYQEWQKVVPINHGYDDRKPESELDLQDVQNAARFRGGECLSKEMEKGNWRDKLEFSCAFGHHFKASPRLVLEGGHWCPVCENKSWNYSERAKKDPFFAQVWTPLHHGKEKAFEYLKKVNPDHIKNVIVNNKKRKCFVP